MKLRSVRKDLTLIPKFNGNRDLPAAEQVTVEFGALPSAIEADGYKEFIFGPDGRIETIRYKDAVIVQRYVKAIRNFSDDDGVIDTGIKLAASRNAEVLPLVYEIRDYVLAQSEPLEPGEG